MHNLDVLRARKILYTQFAAAAVVAAVALAVSWEAGLSALVGGLTAAAANTLVALQVFGRYAARDPARLVARFYGAELLKLLFVGLVFGAVFAWVESVSIAALFGAFVVVQVLPLLLANRVAR